MVNPNKPNQVIQETTVPTTLVGFLKPYIVPISFLVLLTIGANALSLTIPKIISKSIDSFVSAGTLAQNFILEFLIIGIAIFIITLTSIMNGESSFIPNLC